MSVLGKYVTRYDVERGVLSTISTWLETALSDLEKQQGIPLQSIPRPPSQHINDLGSVFVPANEAVAGAGELTDDGQVSILSDERPSSFIGSVDAIGLNLSATPAVIVEANPTGAATHFGSGSYSQMYAITATAVVQGADEDWVRWTADLYGAAVMAALIQGDPTLGGIADSIELVAAPKTLFVDEQSRLVVGSSVEITALVSSVINDLDFVYEPTETAPATWPTVESTDLTFTADPLSNE